MSEDTNIWRIWQHPTAGCTASFIPRLCGTSLAASRGTWPTDLPHPIVGNPNVKQKPSVVWIQDIQDFPNSPTALDPDNSSMQLHLYQWHHWHQPVNASDPTQQTSGTSHNSQLILSGTWCLHIVSSSNFVMRHSKSYEMLMNKHMLRLLRYVKSYKTHSISGFNTFHYISKRRAHLLALRWSLRFPYRTALEWNTDSIRCAVVHLQLIQVRFRSLFFNRGFATNTTCGETLLLSTKSALHITSLPYK